MATIYKFDNPFDGKFKKYEPSAGKSFAEWLMGEFPDGFKQPFKIYRDNPDPENEMGMEECEKHFFKQDEILHIILCPGEVSTYVVIFAVIAAAAAIIIANNIDIPEDTFEDDQGANNRSKGQRNEVRINERIPDIVGRIRSYPDLIIPSYEEFFSATISRSNVDTIQQITEYMSIGVDQYDIDNGTWKQGQTSLNTVFANFVDTVLTDYEVTSSTALQETPSPLAASMAAGDVFFQPDLGSGIKKFYIRTVTVSSPDVLYTVTGDAGVTVGPSTTTVTGFLDDPDPIDTNHLDELNANGDFGSSTIEFNSIGASTGIFLDFAVGDTIGLTVKAVSDNEPDPTDTLSGVYIIDASDNSPGAEIWSLKFPDGSSPSFGFVTRNFLAYRCILTPRRYLTESDRIDIFEPDDFEPQNLKVVRNVQEFSSVELVAPGDVEDQITIDSPTDVIFSNSADTIVSTDSQFDDIAVSSNIGTCISIKPGGFDNDNRLYYIHDNNNAGGTRTLSIKPTPVSDIIEDETVTDITLIEYTVPAGDALKGAGTTTFTVTGYQLVTVSAPTNPEDRPLKGDVIALSFDNDGDHAGAGLFIVSNEPIFADPPNGVTMELVNLDGSLPQTIVSGLVTRWYIVRPIEPEGPFLTPVSSTELWVDFEFLQGLYQNNNGVKNVNAIELEILYTESDINGNPLASTERETVTFSSRSSGKLRFTHKIDVSDDEGFYNVSASRITAKGADSSTQVFVDDVRWVRLAGVNNLFEAFDPRIIDHGDITTVRIISQITSSTTIVPQRSLNTEVTRLLEAFKQDGTNVNPATGAAASPGDKFPTQRFADIFIYRATDSFGVNLSTDEIDFDSIYDIQDELTAYTPVSGPLEPEQGEFNFTFDRRISSDQELRAITNIVRCSVFRIGSEVSIIRDEGDRLPISLFNRRNKSPEGETKTFDFNQRNSHDGVEVTFVSSEIAYREVTFVLGFGVGALVVVNPSPRPLNAKKLRLDGVITWDQAYRRGAYELNRIRFRRDRLTMKVTEDARVLGLNSIVAVSDNLQSPTVDGEVLEIDSSVSTATIVTLDQDVSFGAGTEVITLRDLNGDETQTFLALAGAESNIVIIDLTSDIDTNPLSIELGTSDGTSVGNLYQFYITGSDEIGNYLVEDIDIADEYVRVVLSNYDEDVFANDFIALPTPPLPIT